MRQNVQAVVRILQAVGVDTEISTYPISSLYASLAQGIFIAQISAIVGLLFRGDQASKYQQMFFIWMIGNLFRQLLTQTGAFELWYGNFLVWSSLAEGRLPQISDLVSRFALLGLNIAP